VSYCKIGASDSSVGITADYRLDGMGFDSRKVYEIFLYFTASRPDLEPTQPAIQWILGALSSGIKRPRHEANHSPPTTAGVSHEGGAIRPLPCRSLWRGA
jgi:hypothetical protein